MGLKKLKVDPNVCIGCGCCVGSYLENFRIGDEGVAEVISEEVDEEAIGVCPVGAIVED